MKKYLLFIPAILFLISCGGPGTATLDTDQLIEDLRYLSSDELEGRLTGTEGNRKAREYLIQRFEENGAEPFQATYSHPFLFQNQEGEEFEGINVAGKLDGEIDSVIVITAHYDHLGIREGEIYNGADDNASGTAALLAMIDYFRQKPTRHTLVFAAFDKEEGGLRGARAFAGDSVFLEKVVLNVNMDMISQNTKDEIYAAGTYHYPELRPVLEQVDTEGLKLLFGHDSPDLGYNDWTSASDHGAFHAKGVPFVYFGVEDHEHYHKPSDDFETIPQEFYKKSVQLIINAVIALDQSKLSTL